MKKILLSFTTLFVMFIFTGCGHSGKVNFIEEDDGKESVMYHYNKENPEVTKEMQEISFSIPQKIYNLRESLKAVSKRTLEKGNTHFIILEEGMSQASGELPLNRFLDIKDYCQSKFSTCKSFTQNEFYGYFEYKMLKNPSSTILTMDAKETLKDIENYKITLQEIQELKRRKE